MVDLPNPFISPGVSANLCPYGEIEPSVMKAFAPGENLPSSNEGRPSEAPAAPRTVTVAAGPVGATDQIHEIFHWVRKLIKDDPGFVLDEARFLAEIEEVPLFLREDGYLQRREA